jgi:hypothetical protein
MVSKTKAFELFGELPQTPRRWMSRARMVVGPSTKAIVLGRNACSEAAGTEPIELFLHRRGTERSGAAERYSENGSFLGNRIIPPTPCAKLVAFDTDMEGRVRFMLDDAFTRLPPGRYAAQVMQGCKVCFIFEIAIERKCTVSVSSMDAVSGEDMVIHNGSLPNMTAIFDSLNTFTAKTCRILEPGATQLPLSSADIARLCAVTLCRPVQLLIGDGVKTETVSFAGCAGGVATVTRGVAGSSPARFPVGARVAFSWTDANVAAASEGCV